MRSPLVPCVLVCALSGCLWISSDEHRQRQDLDGDGRVGALDCNEGDPNVYVGALENACDGLDNDCDESTPDGPAQLAEVVYPTIQDAIDAAQPGELVEVCPGTWAESFEVTKNITVQGAFGGGDVVVDATGLGTPVVRVTSSATVRDLTLRGGTGAPNPEPGLLDAETMGGGVLALEAPGDVTLSGLVVVGCSADAGGGIVGPREAELSLTGSTVSANTATGIGGGVVMFGGDLEATTIEGNSAEDGGGLVLVGDGTVSADSEAVVQANTATRGGGVWLDDGATLNGGFVSDNAATASGGGVWMGVGATLSGTEIRLNTATTGGGVAALDDTSLFSVRLESNSAERGGGVHASGSIVVNGATITNNEATVDLGGGLYGEAGLVTLQDDTFSSNLAGQLEGRGGAVSVTAAVLEVAGGEYSSNSATHGGAIHASGQADCPDQGGCGVGLRGGVIFDGNVATGDGGAVWSIPLVSGAGMTFRNNRAARGGALYVEGLGFDIAGCQITGNEAEDGGALYLDLADFEARTEACDITANFADTGAAAYIARGRLRVESGDVVNNEADAAVHMRPGPSPGEDTVLTSVGCVWAGNETFDVYMGGGQDPIGTGNATCTYTSSGDGQCL